MIRIDLVTGFLGAGKTTFLLKYVRFLTARGLRVGVLEYDTGAVNVDMLLLSGLRGPLCELEMVAASCDTDCLARRLRTRLISMAMSGYDRVVMEPTGAFDMDRFFDALCEPPLDRWYEVGTVITVVSAGLEEELGPAGEALLASQAACAGSIVLSRTQCISPENARAHLLRAAGFAGLSGGFRGQLFEKPWDLLEKTDLERIMAGGYTRCDSIRSDAADVFSSVCFLGQICDLMTLKEKIGKLFASRRCGRVLRVKGCLLDNGQWFSVNATQRELLTEPIASGQSVLIVTGSALNEAEIRGLMG